MIPSSKPKSTLANLLNDYTATARAALKSHATSHLGRWSIYAAATGAALASATSAEASIITGNVGRTLSLTQSHIVTNCTPGVNCTPGHASGFLPLISAGGKQIGTLAAALSIVRYSKTHSHGTRGVALLATGSHAGGVFTGGYIGFTLRRFPRSQAIVSRSRYSSGCLVLAKKWSTFSGGRGSVHVLQFASNAPGYAGFRLGNWIQLTWSSAAGNGIPDTLAVGRWAVNTDGPIYAGLPTPEPGTLPLTLLAMGAAGIAAWRKRRTKESEAPAQVG